MPEPRYEGVVVTSSHPAASLPPSASRADKLAHGGVVRAINVPTGGKKGGGNKGGQGGGGQGGGGGGGQGIRAGGALAAEPAPAPADPLAALKDGQAGRWADEADDDGGGGGTGAKAETRATGEEGNGAAAAADGGEDEAAAAAAELKSLGLSAVPPRPNEKLGYGVMDVEPAAAAAEAGAGDGGDGGGTAGTPPGEAVQLYEGDLVTFCLGVEKNGGGRGATRIRLVTPKWERGFVAQVRASDGFGHIKPAGGVGSRGGSSVYFSLAALGDASAALPRPNDEVEYRVASALGGGGDNPRGRQGYRGGGGGGDGFGDGRPSAGVVRMLPRGTIITEWLLGEWWLAKVAKPPGRSGGGGAAGAGQGRRQGRRRRRRRGGQPAAAAAAHADG